MAYWDPSTYRLCHDNVLLLFLALYLLITNILLINLLIAIFSHSYEEIEKNSVRVWRYDFYRLTEEYNRNMWAPPPLNILWVMIRIAISCCYRSSGYSLTWKEPLKRHQNAENVAFKRWMHAVEKDERSRNRI